MVEVPDDQLSQATRQNNNESSIEMEREEVEGAIGDNISGVYNTNEVFNAQQLEANTRQSFDTNATAVTFAGINVEGAILTDSEDGGQQ